jgi:catechol 2,3-dioxygenase-like lactoylglutathione lyase family enzyme
MLSQANVHATIAVKNLDEVKKFYSDKLGLTSEQTPGGLIYRCGEGSWFFLYSTATAQPVEHTVMGWNVDNIEDEVKELKSHGVEFIEYDIPQLKTTDGIATFEGNKAAWFKDPEDNVLSLIQITSK